MIVAVVILSVVSVVLLFTTFNLLRKNEKQEDVLVSYLEYMNMISKIIEHSSDRLKKIDAAGTFSSDDEIGWFFEEVKAIQNRLDNFKLLDVSNDRGKEEAGSTKE